MKRAARAAAVELPFSPRMARRLLFGGLLLLLGAAFVVWALVARLPERGLLRAAAAGFAVRQVDIRGLVHQPRIGLYRQLLSGGSDSMFLFDPEAARRRLLRLSWVDDVRVERRWPDRLVVELRERQPAALWQNQGRMQLVDETGRILDAEDLASFSHLPLLVGDGADQAVAPLLLLLGSAPAVAGRMEAAIRVGKRRWDLRMDGGETISLPEDARAGEALARFVALDRQQALLGRGFVRFDLRIPDQLVVRVGKEPGAAARPAVPAAAAAPAVAI